MVSFNQFIIILSRVDELFLALYMLILTFIYFTFPFNKKILSKISNSSKFNSFDAISINFVFHFCFLLILSFFKINHLLIGYVIVFLAILMNLNLIKSIKLSLLNSLFFIFLLVYTIKFTSFASLEWDGLSHWFYKTQIFYQDGSLTDFLDIKLDGMMSRIFQHEFDHMQGQVFTNKVSKLKLDRAHKKAQKEMKKLRGLTKTKK